MANTKANRKANPMKTKNDKVRLGPLNLTQLNELLTKSNKPKDKDKIARHIRNVEKRA
jgi:hypothetical protein